MAQQIRVNDFSSLGLQHFCRPSIYKACIKNTFQPGHLLSWSHWYLHPLVVLSLLNSKSITFIYYILCSGMIRYERYEIFSLFITLITHADSILGGWRLRMLDYPKNSTHYIHQPASMKFMIQVRYNGRRNWLFDQICQNTGWIYRRCGSGWREVANFRYICTGHLWKQAN